MSFPFYDDPSASYPPDVYHGETGEASASVDDSVSEVGPTTLTTDPTADPTTDPTADPTSATGDTTSALDDSTSAGSTMTATSLETSVTSTGTDEDTTAGPKPFEVEVVASIAVCTEAMLFDPAHCALETSENQFTVDGSDGDANVARGWIRFDLGDELAGAEILSIELTLTTGPDANDGSDQTGVLWQTAAFDLAALEIGDPELLEMLSDDLGAVAVST